MCVCGCVCVWERARAWWTVCVREREREIVCALLPLNNMALSCPPDSISHVCSLTCKSISQKYFTYRPVQIFKIMFQRFLFSRIWSSAQDHALLDLLLNLVGLFIFTRPRWSGGNDLYHSCTSFEGASRGGQPFNIFTWFIGAGGYVCTCVCVCVCACVCTCVRVFVCVHIISYVTIMNESCCTYESITSHLWMVMLHVWCSIVLHCVALCCSGLQCVALCCVVLHCVALCCIVLHRVAVCCSVMQCVAVCCSVMQCVAVWCSVSHCVVLHCVVLCCSALQCDAVSARVQLRTILLQCDVVRCSVLDCVAVGCKVLECVAACWSVLQRVAAWCSMLQCVAVCCSVLQWVLTFSWRWEIYYMHDTTHS